MVAPIARSFENCRVALVGVAPAFRRASARLKKCQPEGWRYTNLPMRKERSRASVPGTFS